MTIKEASPEATDLGEAFAKAMNTPSKPKVDATTPPEVDHEAPHGRDPETGEPLAPYGFTRYGRPAKSAAGRKRDGRETGGTDRARVSKPAAARQDDEKPSGGGKPEGAKPSGKNYMGDLSAFGDAVWFGASALSSVGSSIPIIGKWLPEDKLAAQAFVLSETKPRLVAAINLAAQHNVKAEEFCKKLEGGDGFWALQCMFMVMPVISLSAAVWKGDKALAEMSGDEELSLKVLAAKNKDRMDLFMAHLAAQMEAAQQEAMAVQAEVIEDASDA